MADWTSLNASSLPFVTEATTLLNQLKPILTGAGLAAQATQVVLATSVGLLDIVPDPGEAVREAINILITDLVNTGLFTLVIKPDLRNRSGLTGIDGYARVIKNAFNDQGDLNRPAFGTGDTTAGIVFLISGPSFGELSALAEGFQILFGNLWQELVDFVNHVQNQIPHLVVEGTGSVTSIPEGGDPKKTFVDSSQVGFFTNANFDPFKGQRIQMLTGKNAGLSARVGSFDNSTLTYVMNPAFRYDLQKDDIYVRSFVTTPSPPDWQSLRVVDNVPICAEVTEVLANLRDLIPPTGQVQLNLQISTLLQRKANVLSQIEARIDAVIALFERLDDVPLISMLAVPDQDFGNGGFTREVFNAGNVPSIGSEDFTLGIVLYGGSGILNVLSKIFPI